MIVDVDDAFIKLDDAWIKIVDTFVDVVDAFIDRVDATGIRVLAAARRQGRAVPGLSPSFIAGYLACETQTEAVRKLRAALRQ